MSRVMLTASEARLKSLQDIYVLREIRDLEEHVILAAAAGKVEVTITSTSTMAKTISEAGYALATDYFNAWNGTRDDRQKILQMSKIIQYFSDLGYTIERQINPGTQTTFQWILAW